MNNHYVSFRRNHLAIFMSLSIFFGSFPTAICAQRVHAAVSLVVLTQYKAVLSIGQEFYLGAVPTNGKKAVFKSSNSKIASVSTYGRVTAKQPGNCRITVKAGNAESSCRVTVKKTVITLSDKKLSMENGKTIHLHAVTSNGSIPTYSSNKKSVAVVDSSGNITACKPGTAVISVSADKTTVNCKITVKKPTIVLNHIYRNLFRCQQVQLKADVSSGIRPVWKSSRSKVATVNDNGLVCALRHGTAIISAKADGVTKTCEIEVSSPVIKLSATSLTMKVGQTKTLNYKVSSGNAPLIRSSKPNIVKTDQLGNLTARSKGTAIITFTEDGTRETCSVKVK